MNVTLNVILRNCFILRGLLEKDENTTRDCLEATQVVKLTASEMYIRQKRNSLENRSLKASHFFN